MVEVEHGAELTGLLLVLLVPEELEELGEFA